MRLLRHGGSLAAIAALVVLAAGQSTPVRAALSYDVSLGAGVHLNDNLHLDPRTAAEEGLRQPVSETIITLNPGIRVSWDEMRDLLELRYSGEYSMFQGDEERDSLWMHDLTADLRWRRWAPFFLEAREELSRVPRAQEREVEALVDQVDRNRLFVRTGLVSEMDARNTVELAYRGELETYSGVRESVTDAGIEEFDRVERHYGETLVRHRWSPLWAGVARVTYGQVDRELASDYAELRVSATVDQRWSEHLALRYRLEWLREDDGETVAEETTTGVSRDSVRSNLLAAAEIRGDLARGGAWTLAYEDSLEDQPDGDTLKTGRASAAAAFRARPGNTLDIGGWYETRDYRESGREEEAWGPTLGLRWLIAPRAALDFGGSWTSTTIQRQGLAEVEDRTTRAAVGMVFLMFKQLQADVGYGYVENDSTDALRSYSNNLFFALLTFHFKPVDRGRLPSSYASGLVEGGAPSGGVTLAGEGGGGLGR